MSTMPFDIVGYTYNADIYCPSCIVDELPSPSAPPSSAETHLDSLAEWFGIDRMDENSFDSDHFPKVVFRDQMPSPFDEPEICGRCTRDIDN